MNPIRSTVFFEHGIPGADILLLISAANDSHFEPNLFLLSRVQGADMSIPTCSSDLFVPHSKACDIIPEDTFRVACMMSDIRGIPNWDWKNSKQSLPISEYCKKTTHHTKWPSLILLNLSRASYMFGRIDIKWVTFMRACNPKLFQ